MRSLKDIATDLDTAIVDRNRLEEEIIELDNSLYLAYKRMRTARARVDTLLMEERDAWRLEHQGSK